MATAIETQAAEIAENHKPHSATCELFGAGYALRCSCRVKRLAQAITALALAEYRKGYEFGIADRGTKS